MQKLVPGFEVETFERSNRNGNRPVVQAMGVQLLTLWPNTSFRLSLEFVY